MFKLKQGLYLLLLSLILGACTVAPPTQPPTASPPTQSPATAVPAPPETPVPAATVPPETTRPTMLSADGPWVVIISQDGIWAANEDGSELTQVTQDFIPWQVAAASGKWVAYVTADETGFDLTGNGMTLKIFALPDLVVQTVTNLSIPDVTEDSSEDLQFAAQHVYRAVVFDGGGPTWSPDGQMLAFVSGHDGVSSDVYVYHLDTGQIVRLTDGPSHAYQLDWSPDGKYIFHTGSSNFGTGAGHVMDGVWVARADGTGVRSLYDPDPASGDEVLVDWLADDTTLMYSWRPDCGSLGLSAVNVDSGEVQVLWPDYFNYVLYDPATDTILMDADDIYCNTEEESGFYVSAPAGAAMEQISAEEYHARLPESPPDQISSEVMQYLSTQIDIEKVILVQP